MTAVSLVQAAAAHGGWRLRTGDGAAQPAQVVDSRGTTTFSSMKAKLAKIVQQLQQSAAARQLQMLITAMMQFLTLQCMYYGLQKALVLVQHKLECTPYL